MPSGEGPAMELPPTNPLGFLSSSAFQMGMVAAIPHWLDDDIANLIFPGNAEKSLEMMDDFRLLDEDESGRLVLRAPVRKALLDQWQAPESVEQFRRINAALAIEFDRRSKEQPDRTRESAEEMLFHALAASPEVGMLKTVHAFNGLIEGHETGAAEHLHRLICEQEPWLDSQRGWLEYFPAALETFRYEKADLACLEDLARQQPESLLAVYTLRLESRADIRSLKWSRAEKKLQRALDIAGSLGDIETTGLLKMDLGGLYARMVENSGGILLEKRTFANPAHALFYGLSHGPTLIYRLLAERINSLPNLYGSNYQNWVAMRWMRLARRNYQQARNCFAATGDLRGLVDISIREGQILLDLDYPNTARQVCENALAQPEVAASPYYQARAGLIIAQAVHRHRANSATAGTLEQCLSVLEQCGDWETAAQAALVLASQYKYQKQPVKETASLERCLIAARHASDALSESEAARRLELLAINGSKQAATLRESITSITYIDRFPGQVRITFGRLARGLIYPFMVLFLIGLIVLTGRPLQVLEGELLLRVGILEWTQIPALMVQALMPFLVVWSYHLVYILLGQIAAVGLSIAQVEKSQPDMYVINEDGVTQTDRSGTIIRAVRWDEVRVALVDFRSLHRRPLTFSARTILNDGKTTLELPATLYRYEAAQAQVLSGLGKRSPASAKIQVMQNTLSILRTRWLWVALIVGALLAWLLSQFYSCGCYMEFGAQMTDTDFKCPARYQTCIQFGLQATLLFGSITLLVITAFRWARADRLVQRVRNVQLREPSAS